MTRVRFANCAAKKRYYDYERHPMHCVEALFTEEKGLHEDVRLVEKTQTPKADDAEDWPA